MSTLDEITTEVSALKAENASLKDRLTSETLRRDQLAREVSWLRSQVDNYIVERKKIREELERAVQTSIASNGEDSRPGL